MNKTVAITENDVLASCVLETSLSESCDCAQCGHTVRKGSAAFIYRFFSNAPEMHHVSHTKCFKGSSLFRVYNELFLTNHYVPMDFAARPFGFDNAYHALLLNFDFRNTLHRLAYPGPLSSSGGVPNTSAPMILIDILLKCGYRARLLQDMRTLPGHAVLLLAMHDDPAFQAEAARIFNEPTLEAALDALRSGLLSADDIASFIELGQRNPKLLNAAAEAIAHYGLDESCAMRSPGFYGFAKARYMQLIFLCASSPVSLPAMSCYMRTGEFGVASDTRYARALRYYHRAAMFHLAMFKPEELPDWISASCKWLSSAGDNSCSRYIAATCNMISGALVLQPA